MMTVTSMTGFGRAQGALSDRLSGSVVVRSVNHRYLDVMVRTNLREELPEVDATLREVVAKVLKRGRVTVQVNLDWIVPPDSRVLVSSEAVKGVLNQLREVAGSDGEPGVTIRDVLAVPGLVSVSASETLLTSEELARLSEVAGEAVAQQQQMRSQEGKALYNQIVAELGEIGAFLDWFEPQMSSFRQRILQRLQERLAELMGPDTQLEPERLATEAAVMADRSDVAEEVVRLRSHLQSFSDRLHKGGVVGRSLDFLCQEVNRELNTLGSKCREPGLAERLVDAKTAIERVREQVQNLE
jgi:uncharacterized protein (TIGR00255 family)